MNEYHLSAEHRIYDELKHEEGCFINKGDLIMFGSDENGKYYVCIKCKCKTYIKDHYKIITDSTEK